MIIGTTPTKINSPLTNVEQLSLATVFIICCLFGITLGIRPRWYHWFYQKTTKQNNQKSHKQIKRRLKGHHPTCPPFQYHTLGVKNTRVCAGCLGLSLGALIAIGLTITQQFYNIVYPSSLFLIVLGILLVILTYIDVLILKTKPFYHIFINIFFLIGFYFIFTGTLQHTQNVSQTFLTIILLLILLQARTTFSWWRHHTICQNCDDTCKMY